MLNWLKLKIVKSGQMLATKEAEIQPIRMRLAKFEPVGPGGTQLELV